MNTEIICYCREGRRAQDAVMSFIELGYRHWFLSLKWVFLPENCDRKFRLEILLVLEKPSYLVEKDHKGENMKVGSFYWPKD